MNKSLFYLICAVFGGLILLCGTVFAARYGYATPSLLSIALSYTIIVALCAVPNIRKQCRHLLCDYDWAEECKNAYFRIPDIYRRSFWIIFGFVNLAFLFHTINFMWGNQDWGAIRFDVDINDSLQDGRFSAYWLQALLFDGKILPVINNLWAFFGLSIAAIQLCIYWHLPKNCKTYVITGLFFLITPYTLSWLYFAKNMLGNLWLPCIILSALLLAQEKSASTIKIYFYNLISVLLLITALGTYFPALEFIAIAVLGKILIKTVFSDISLRVSLIRFSQTLLNIIAAFVIYCFILLLINNTLGYNSHISSLENIVSKLPMYFQTIILQFISPLPFIDSAYQYLNLGLVLIATFTVILKSPSAHASLRALIVLPIILLFTRLSYLLTETDNALYLARMDFYALPLIYTLALVLIIKMGGFTVKRIGYVLAVLLIFMSFVRVAYAQKVWKFGWDAETKLSERIITRLEKLPEFNIEHQYKLLQIGEQSLRLKYYLPKTNENKDGALLSWSYYPAENGKDAYNFYYQTDFLNGNADKNEAYKISAIREYLLNQARPWPHKESIRIIGDYIILVMDDRALQKAQRTLDKFF